LGARDDGKSYFAAVGQGGSGIGGIEVLEGAQLPADVKASSKLSLDDILYCDPNITWGPRSDKDEKTTVAIV
jgi:hypothetical protein